MQQPDPALDAPAPQRQVAEVLAAAERARRAQRHLEAAQHYEQAALRAKDQGWLPDEALAHEGAAECLAVLGLATASEAHWRLAHAAYARCGANDKLRALEQAHAFLLPGAAQDARLVDELRREIRERQEAERVPVWFAFGGRGKHGPSAVGTIYSDDHGATWKGGDVVIPNEGAFKSPNESVLVELADGRVMLNARSPSEPNRRLVTISPDGISNWSTPTFDQELWEPICAAGLTSLSTEPHTLIYSSPRNLKLDDNDKPVPAGQGARRNLTIYLSEDDGKTWKARRTLEEGTSAYSDLVTLADGTILCFYERDQRLTLARFSKSWILAGQADE